MDALRDDLTPCGMIPKPRTSTKEKGSAPITPTAVELGWRSPDDDSLQKWPRSVATIDKVSLDP